MDMRKLLLANQQGAQALRENMGGPSAVPMESAGTSMNVETAALLTSIHSDPSLFKRYEKAVLKYRKEAATDVAVQSGRVTPDDHVVLSLARDLRNEYGTAEGKGAHQAVLSAALHEVDFDAVARDIVTDASVMVVPAGGSKGEDKGDEVESEGDAEDKAPEFGSDEAEGDEEEAPEFGSDEDAEEAPEFGSDEADEKD